MEVVGFENAVRAVAVRAVKAAFTRISAERLGSYLDLNGMIPVLLLTWNSNMSDDAGPDLEAYLHDLGWAIERSNSVVIIPPNPDNQIEATVVQESIKLPRKLVNRASRGER